MSSAKTLKKAPKNPTHAKNARSTPAKSSKPKPAAQKPKPSRTGVLARPAKVEVTVDRALKDRWVALLAKLEDAKREGAGAFDVQWETVGAIVEHEPPLYLAGGFATVRDFLEKHVGENERTARRFIRVAKYASPAEEAKYGVSRLDRAIAYVEAKAGGPAKGRLPVAFDKLEVPVEVGGKTTMVPLDKAQVLDIEAATRKLVRAGEEAAPAKASPLVKAVVAQLKSKALHGITVRTTGGKLFLGAIPTSSLADLAAALLRIKLPTED
jgi:hypothetical protein